MEDRLRHLAIILVLTSSAIAGIIDDVRGSLAQNNFTAAESELNVYKAKLGVTPEYLEALSWMGRAALSMQQYAQAEGYAKQTLASGTPLLKEAANGRGTSLADRAGRGDRSAGTVFGGTWAESAGSCRIADSLLTYGNTSIGARLHKNLNLLNFVGQPAPALKANEFLGKPLSPIAQLKGSPLLLFFWAHWCADCKGEYPILAKLKSEFKGLTIIAPTQRYGYAARGEDATPQAELEYIKKRSGSSTTRACKMPPRL